MIVSLLANLIISAFIMNVTVQCKETVDIHGKILVTDLIILYPFGFTSSEMA